MAQDKKAAADSDAAVKTEMSEKAESTSADGVKACCAKGGKGAKASADGKACCAKGGKASASNGKKACTGDKTACAPGCEKKCCMADASKAEEVEDEEHDHE